MDKADEKQRVEAYIRNVEGALEKIDRDSIEEKFRRLIDLASAYLYDSKYYLEKGDVFTSLACIAYAEGLIDSLRHSGIMDIEWKPLTQLLSRPKVLVAGGFEIIHPGHIYLFKNAWEKGRVYAIVARDVNFERFKGRKPVIPEDQRRYVVENIRWVYKALLGDEKDYIKPIEKVKPDIILLGPDQWASEEKLKAELEKRGITKVKIERLRRRINSGLYSVTRIIEEIKRTHGCIGEKTSRRV